MESLLARSTRSSLNHVILCASSLDNTATYRAFQGAFVYLLRFVELNLLQRATTGCNGKNEHTYSLLTFPFATQPHIRICQDCHRSLIQSDFETTAAQGKRMTEQLLYILSVMSTEKVTHIIAEVSLISVIVEDP